MNLNKKILLSLAVTLGVSTAATMATAYVNNYMYQNQEFYQQQPPIPAQDKDGSLFPGGPCKSCSKDGSLFPGGPCKSCTKDGSLFPGPCKKCEIRREQPVIAQPSAPAVQRCSVFAGCISGNATQLLPNGSVGFRPC
ncbi:MAG: hypothetical protein MJ212_03640 [Alphaproteobacteria bacterium]|nr:hypothetical protein [Alphaproteobacteria bacterium]